MLGVKVLDIRNVEEFQSRTSSQVHQRWNPRNCNTQEAAKEGRRPQRVTPTFLLLGFFHPAQIRGANVGE